MQTVSSNPNAIGYASLASVGDSVKTVEIEGIELMLFIIIPYLFTGTAPALTIKSSA